MNLKDSWSHFWEGVPIEEFREKVNELDEPQLRYLHKQMQRKRIGGGTSAAIGAAAFVPSCGVSSVGIAIGARRIFVNTDRIDIIERRLKDKGWDGHHLEGRDFALPVTAAIVGLGVGFGIDAIIDSVSAGGEALVSAGGTTTSTVPIPSDITTPSIPAQDLGTAGFVPPPPPPIVPDIPPPVPEVSWVQTDAGIQMAVNDMPVDSTYGQVTDSGLYQTPILPTDSNLGWTPAAETIPPTPSGIQPQTLSGGYVPGASGWLSGGAAAAIAHLGSNVTQHGLPHAMQALGQQAKEAFIEKGGAAAAKGGYEKAWQVLEDRKVSRRLSKWLK